MASAFQSSAFQNNAFQISSPPPPTVSGPAKNDIFLYPVKAFANPNDIKLLILTKAATSVGWMPEWRFRHDPEELERRLKAQKESAFSPQWLDRFLAAEEQARARLGKAKTAKHRAALEEAVEQTAARVSEAIDEGWAAPEELIIALEAAAGASRVTASIRHAEHLVELASAYADWQDEDEIEMLLLH